MTVKKIGRAQVVKRILAHYEEPRYLEVGVCAARTFDQIPATEKVAVDPKFRFDPAAEDRQAPGVSYHQVTSDEYFGSIVGADELFDVIYLDGLHTVEQTLRDLLNALEHLQPRGVVVIDDVLPPTELAAIADRQEFLRVRREAGREEEKAWMGDVFRLVYFIDTFCQQLSFGVIDNNHGQAVVWRQRRETVTPRGLAEVGGLTFAELDQDREALRLAPFGQILRQVRRDLGLRTPD